MPLFNQRLTQWKYALEEKSEELFSKKKKKRRKKKNEAEEALLSSLIKYLWMGATRIAF